MKIPGADFTGKQEELYLEATHPGAIGPYERLLGDALIGNAELFARQDSVGRAWAVVQPVLENHGNAYPYKNPLMGSPAGRRDGPSRRWVAPARQRLTGAPWRSNTTQTATNCRPPPVDPVAVRGLSASVRGRPRRESGCRPRSFGWSSRKGTRPGCGGNGRPRRPDRREEPGGGIPLELRPVLRRWR
jgi:hypothetical protein